MRRGRLDSSKAAKAAVFGERERDRVLSFFRRLAREEDAPAVPAARKGMLACPPPLTSDVVPNSDPSVWPKIFGASSRSAIVFQSSSSLVTAPALIQTADSRGTTLRASTVF